MKNANGNTRSLTCKENVEEKKKWLSTIKGDDTIHFKKGVDSKNLKNIALSFFKEKNIYNEENVAILNAFCKEKLDDHLVNEEIVEFLQKAFFLYEYFIKEKKKNKISKKEFIENVCECCRRIFLKNIIKNEKEILDFLLKNLINFINQHSFFSIYQSLYNISQYQNKNFRRANEYAEGKFQLLLNVVRREVKGGSLLVNDNRFNLEALYLPDENDEKEMREYYAKIVTSEQQGGKGTTKGSSKEEETITKKGGKERKKGAILKSIGNRDVGNQAGETWTPEAIAEMEYLDKELSCFYLFLYFQSCFENINFYLIEKFIENYYISQGKENIYKELFLFLFLIYKDKMHSVVDGILINTINYLSKANDTEVRKKKKLLNEEGEVMDQKVHLTDYLFYFELLINIITFKNLQYKNNYEYYIHMLKLLYENDQLQELFTSSLFFVFISTDEGAVRNVLLANFSKYHSRKHEHFSKFYIHLKNVFRFIYDIDSDHLVYNHTTFNGAPISPFLHPPESEEKNQGDYTTGVRVKQEYLPFVADNIHIDKYICAFFKEAYYIISRSNTEYFCQVTNLYLHIYDHIFNKLINIIYENEMNLNDEFFQICECILRPFLFIYVELFNNFLEKYKEKIFNERLMLSFAFIKKYLFKSLYEKAFQQKDLFYVIYQFYFLLYALKYNFRNFLTALVMTKRKVTHQLQLFLKLKYQNCTNMPSKSLSRDGGRNALQDTSHGEGEHNSSSTSDEGNDHNCRRGQSQKKKDQEGGHTKNKRNRQKKRHPSGEHQESEQSDNYSSENSMDSSLQIVENSLEKPHSNEEKEKKNIINFFQKNYWTLKYFEANTEKKLDEFCSPDFSVPLVMKETPKLKKRSVSNNQSDKKEKSTGDGGSADGREGASTKGYDPTKDEDQKGRFVRKLHSFFAKKNEVDKLINELFLNNKDNVYSKILKTNLAIIKQLANTRMDVLYPIFNASLVFLFDDFYFFIIQNIKLVIEGKEKKLSNHKIFLNMSFILLHTFVKDVKVEKYLVSIFYILRLSLNKIRKIKIIDQQKTQGNNVNEVYNKNTKKFENNVKYYNLRKDKDLVKANISEMEEENENSDELQISADKRAISTLHKIEEKVKLYQNIFYIFLKLVQNILKENNLYYNFKFIIYDILFCEFSNKGIIFSCMKCILDRARVEEVYAYSLAMLSGMEHELGGADSAADNMTNNVTNKATNKAADKATNNMTNNGTNNMTDSMTDNMSDNVTAPPNRSHLSRILSTGNSFKVNFFEPSHASRRKVSSLYINVIILYFILTQKNKNNEKSKLYDNYLKMSVDDYYSIANKVLCLLYTKEAQNAYYERYLKYLCLKILKKIYCLISIKEADMYLTHLKGNSAEDIIFEDEKLKKINRFKEELIGLFRILSNYEIKNYFDKKSGHKTSSEEYKFFFLKNLSCNNNVLKNDNVCFMISSLLFVFSLRYDKTTFYKIVYIILVEKNENKNYILEKVISSVKKFIKLADTYNCVHKENKRRKIRLPDHITNYSVLLYTVRTSILLLLLMDSNSINKPALVQENYITYPNFRSYYIKKKNIKNYYTQLNLLLFRIFYSEKILPYFFKLFFSTLYLISFRKLNQNNFYFFEKMMFNLKEDAEISPTGGAAKQGNPAAAGENVLNGSEDKSLHLQDDNSINLSEKSKGQSSNQTDGKNDKADKKNKKVGKEHVGGEKNRDRDIKPVKRSAGVKRKHLEEEKNSDQLSEQLSDEHSDEHSEDVPEEESTASEEMNKNYRAILRSRNGKTTMLKNMQNEKTNHVDKKYIKIEDSSSSNSTSDSDVSFKIGTKKKNTRKNMDANNNAPSGKKKRKVPSNSSENTTTEEKKRTQTGTYPQEKMQKQTFSKREEVKGDMVDQTGGLTVVEEEDERDTGESLGVGAPTGAATGDGSDSTENFQFNGSLSLKILNHFIFICKGFHEDLEIKIYNGVIACLKENQNDKEKLKNILSLQFSEDEKNSTKYKKKLQLLRIIQTKIIFLTFIKDNLKKRKSLISRMSELNLNIFRNKPMFNIELDFV
ncbi:conserved Plasmodium protein, unknown function [Plasmodium knowlesi strain H]|uniref:Uncharacterized protein n=3 Tax=Plasmodium knowlesi TaxID=5850 RepID=A0A5K1U964_PLAKH|nr:conserved Plasmodium protein, unknown function [Plasmodium knowlesi strain H]OTN65784.1 Uncharacterized protein PKNOH_S100041400 [Plasmodium knowlesi]CAA9987777.1 conserved Plasmodium protein, unknown function [Plasmodium knowlesi strain H]SBO27104.1 conserved Plasmodium protein, unknown function [Plasmodium knowlesi strain H]SBO29420.1 conserved Plasmodium protein, unknown function [Plasmodium knowlesi strain H]VVS77251.1 conserved Plasmodium protein, unknown function [Plasmodium knowlesi |eukprot:XP_002258774.1 hypothetical protein, conserved in Plasmodium species [Plasmodium knowlesi strain H]